MESTGATVNSDFRCEYGGYSNGIDMNLLLFVFIIAVF